MSAQIPLDQLQADKSNLYREENYTDLRVASIRKLVPVKVDGSDDPDRDPTFIGSTQVMSQMGPIPIQAELDAKTLEEALDKLPEALKGAVEEMVEQAREMQREQANRIVVPEARPGGMPGQGGPGGAPGGGGDGGIIQI